MERNKYNAKFYDKDKNLIRKVNHPKSHRPDRRKRGQR